MNVNLNEQLMSKLVICFRAIFKKQEQNIVCWVIKRPLTTYPHIIPNFRLENGEFEELEITPYSSPPDLPDVMKNQDAANGQEQVA